MKFREGILPVKYLGIPLVFTIVKKEYCQKLVDKIITTITCWTTKHLSYAGRVELVNFVVRSTYVYWYCAFILSKVVIKKIDRRCTTFLWIRGVDAKKGGVVA